MKIDQTDVERIAKLAKLHIRIEERERYAEELSHILTLFERLSGIDTSEYSPMAHPLDMVQRLREDVVDEPDLRADLQRIAPDVSDGLYLVPKVIE